jgi:hypothetical protein
VVVLKKTQLLLAGLVVLAALSVGRYAQAANSLTSKVTQNASIGSVIADASGGVTTFKFDTSGNVSKVSGAGVRTSTGVGKAGIVTLTCTSSSCNSKSVTITISAAGVSGRGGVLNNITASAAGVTGGPASSVTLTLTKGFGGSGSTQTSVAVLVGANFPIAGDSAGASSSATSGFTVAASDNGGDSTSISGTASATVTHGLSVASTTTLDFGRIVSSAIGGTVSYPAGTATLTVPSDSKALGSHNLGTVTLKGEIGAAVSISLTSGTLKNGSVVLGTITPTISPGGTQFLVSNGDGTGGKTFNVGGQFTLPAGAAAGTYTGTMGVTAQYN